MRNNTNNSLETLFENQKDILINKLSLVSPIVPNKIGDIIKEFIETLIKDVVETQQYTQAEQMVYNLLPDILKSYMKIIPNMDLHPTENDNKSFEPTPQRSILTTTIIILSTFFLGCIGGFFFNNWLACLGCSMLGLGLALYLTKGSAKTPIDNIIETVENTPIDYDIIEEHLRQMCKDVDAIINTYRYQLDIINQKYESKMSVPFEEENIWLLTEIQSLIGYERYKQDSPNYLEELKERCEDLAATLYNKRLEFIDYDNDSTMFELIEVADIEKPVLTYPAILKDKDIVLRGRVFVPQK